MTTVRRFYLPILILNSKVIRRRDERPVNVTYIDYIPDFLQTVEGNDLLEVVEKSISRVRMGKVGHRRWARP
jgi:hypothetical protein